MRNMKKLLENSKFVDEVLAYKDIDSPLQQCAFRAKLRSSVSTKEDAKSWIAEFSETTSTGWIVLKTFPSLERLAHIYVVENR